MIDFPNIAPQKMSVGLSSNSKLFESVFNKSTTTTKFAGDAITLNMSYEALDSGEYYSEDEAAEMAAFQFELGGISGVAKIPMFHKAGAPAKGKPVTSVAEQLGGSLNTSGWFPKQVVLKRGDYITVNDELKMVLTDIVSDANGEAVISIVPWLRTATTVGTEIITQDPYGLFRSVDDDSVMDFTPMNGATTFEFKEAFYV